MVIKNLFSYWTGQAFAPGSALKRKYAAFKSLLEQDQRAHELMAELEDIFHHQKHVDFSAVVRKYADLSACVRQIVLDLNRMHPTRYTDLTVFFQKIDGYARHMAAVPERGAEPPFCLPLSAVTDSDADIAGGKAMNLARIAGRHQLPTPSGFVITTRAFYRFVQHNRLKSTIDDHLSRIDIQDTEALNRHSERLTAAILQADVPGDVAAEVFEAFSEGVESKGGQALVAVRSSAVAEDGDASFAGQYKTVLNVRKRDILTAYKSVIASKYTPEALVYRITVGFCDMEVPMAVLVVEMVDAKASGVIYTRELDDPDSDLLEIYSIFGLGELLVQGEVGADRFKVLRKNPPVIAEKIPALQTRHMVTDSAGQTRVERLAAERRNRFSIDDRSVLTLASWGLQLEGRSRKAKDIEWCMDHDGQLQLLQSRPLAAGQPPPPAQECRVDDIDNRILIEGAQRASAGTACGTVFVATDLSNLARIPDHAVLVTRYSSARLVRALERVDAVVAENGSAAGHLASVAREFGIPMIVNAASATGELTSGTVVTVFADGGAVYEGEAADLLENPCVRKRPIAESPMQRKLEYILRFVSPLRLLNPHGRDFAPGKCRSLHDVIRFAHESATREMFAIGDKRLGKSRGARKLVSDIPMMIYMVDVGGGMSLSDAQAKTVSPEEITCRPFHAVWNGLNHPGIEWGDFSHFNWEAYDKIVMSGGIISAESAQFASYAVLSSEYMNLNLKFGYHFVILDTLCHSRTTDNHILFRFNGGGGDEQGKSLRAEFLEQVLRRLHFEVNRTSDLVDARFYGAPQNTIVKQLDLLGRLLGATRLMDMYMHAPGQVDPFVEAFLNGRYHFSSVALDPSRGQ